MKPTNDTARREDLLLSEDERKKLQILIAETGTVALAARVGLSVYTIVRAAAGLPVRYASAELLRSALA